MPSWTLASSLGFSREHGKSLLQIPVFISTKETDLKRCLLPEDEEVVATVLGKQAGIILEVSRLNRERGKRTEETRG